MATGRIRIVDVAGDSAMDEANNAVKVNVVAGGAAGGTSATDESAFTHASTAGTPLMGAVNPSDTPADGKLAIVAVDSSRRLKVAGSFSASAVTSTTASTPAQTTVGTTAASVLAANANRKRMYFQNCGTTKIYLNFGATDPTTSVYHLALPMGGSTNDGSSPIFRDEMWIGEVRAISSGAGGLLNITELT